MAQRNVFDAELTWTERPGFRYGRAKVGRQAGAERLGASLYELPPGEATFPYHWHEANEELLVVLRGHPSLRTPEGWRELAEGEVVAFPVGPGGAHQIANRSGESARFLLVSEMNAPELSVYPDSGKLAAMSRAPGAPAEPDEIFALFRRADAVDYWSGEEPPAADEER